MEKNIIIGSDHGGFEMKEIVIEVLKSKGYKVEDVGCFNAESVHYPTIAKSVASKVSEGAHKKGILICGTGIGMSIAANRFSNVKATLCHDHFTAQMSREHNDSNILVLGGRTTGVEIAKEILETWLSTDFQGGRHKERIDLFDQLT